MFVRTVTSSFTRLFFTGLGAVDVTVVGLTVVIGRTLSVVFTLVSGRTWFEVTALFIVTVLIETVNVFNTGVAVGA